MKFTLSLAVAAASIFSAATAYGSYDDEFSLYAREAESYDDEFSLYAREAELLDDDELFLAARDLVNELTARSLSRSSSSSSGSGLFAAPLGSGRGQPAHNGGFSPQSPTRDTPHFVRTGAYELDGNNGRRHSTGSSNSLGNPSRPSPPRRANTMRR